MRPIDIIKEVDKLDLPEKLMLVEEIWDLIAKSNSVLPMLEWQKIELDKRYSDYKSGKLNLYEWQEVHTELREKYK